jgi:hypothetical protein
MKRTDLFIMIAIVSIALLPIVLAQSSDNLGYCRGMMSGFYGGYGSAFMILSWITAILLICLIAAAIYWLIKSVK